MLPRINQLRKVNHMTTETSETKSACCSTDSAAGPEQQMKLISNSECCASDSSDSSGCGCSSETAGESKTGAKDSSCCSSEATASCC